MTLTLANLETRCEAAAVAPTTDTGYRSYGSGGRLFLPAGVNLVTNPTAAEDLTGYTPQSDGNPTIDRVTSVGALVSPVGGAIVKTTAPFTSARYMGFPDVFTSCTTTIPVTAGLPYYWSFYMHCPDFAGGKYSAQVFYWKADNTAATPGNLWLADPVGPANSSFVRYGCPFTPPANTTKVTLQIRTMTAAFSGYITGMMLEQSPVLTPYFDGTYPECAWTGAANASTSTREASVLSGYPYVMPAGSSGTMVSRFTPLYSSTTNPGSALAIMPLTSGLPRVYSPWTDSARLVLPGGTGGTSEVNFGAYAAGSSHGLIARWSPTTLDLMVDGASGAQAAVTSAAFENTTLAVGQDGGSGNTANGYLGPLAMCPFRITDAETALLNAMLTEGATAIDVFRFFQIRGYDGTLVIPLEANATAYVVTAQPDAITSTFDSMTAALAAYMPHGLIVFDGDSWTEGEHYAPYVLAAITPRPDSANVSHGGHGWEHLIAETAVLADAEYAPLAQYDILAVVAGLNDYAVGRDPGVVIPEMVAYCQARRDAGYKVVVGSCGPDQLAGVAASYDANRAIHNAYLAAHWNEFADAYADFTADPYIGLDDSPTTQSAYWANGAHPNATGYGVLAGYVAAAVRSLIEPASASAASAASVANAATDAKLDAVLLKTNTLGGAGAIEWTYTLTTPDGAPIADAYVWVTTDEAGNNVIASGRTDAFGVVTFHLDPGGYFIWAQKSGTNFDNPDFETVTA